MTQADRDATRHDGRVAFDDAAMGELELDLADRSPQEVIAWGLETFGDRVAIVTALQTGGMAIVDMATRIRPDVRVITVDTGRLPQETHDFIDQVRAHYPCARWEILSPDAAEVQAMVARRGVNLFRNSVPERTLCCQVRKVRPLAIALRNLDAWFTGLRRDQSALRAAINKVDVDPEHPGMVKINPLADWDGRQVDRYLAEHAVPRHPLYAQGYTSIGCAPCTRPTRPGEGDRAGRWWWEIGAPKECGIHYTIESLSFEHEPDAVLPARVALE